MDEMFSNSLEDSVTDSGNSLVGGIDDDYENEQMSADAEVGAGQVTDVKPKRKVRLDDFALLKVIGKGSFGKVFFWQSLKYWITLFCSSR